MASYRYERDIDPKDIAPRKERQYTRKERWANWWDYNLKWVIIYGLEPQLEMECAKRKLHIPDDMEKKGEIVVPQFFIDSNHHMNNEKYVMLAQQLLPNDFEISELRVEYRKEAKLGDTVISYVKYTSKSVTVVLADTDKKPYSVVEFLSKPVPGK